MEKPFLGSEALATGRLTRGELRWHHRAVLPDVYLAKSVVHQDLYLKAMAAWLWTRRTGIIAGRTAAALHGVEHIPDSAPVEIIARPRTRQRGVIVRNERVAPDEVALRGRLPVTSPARTAFDLARRLPRDAAVTDLDALSASTELTRSDVLPLESRYRGSRGTAAISSALWLMDGRSGSPKETMLRLWLIDGGLPRPQAGVVIADDEWESTVSIGWPTARVAVELAENRSGLPGDVEFRDLLNRTGWRLVEVLPVHGRSNVVYRCRAALRRHGVNC